jgi:hypothetical protein
MITTNFINNTLEVFKNGMLVISQPFKPTSTGEQISWTSESEALAWFDTIKAIYEYDPPVVEPPPTGAESPSTEQQGV